MDRKDHIDAFGAAALIGFSALLGLNQVVIKITNEALQPVFMAGLRSLGAMCVLMLWMRWRGEALGFTRVAAPSAILAGLLFAGEFVMLFVALDYTSVARASIMFYTMPVWFALMAHVGIPGERLTASRLAGLALAVAGVAWALLNRPGSGAGSLLGDLLALCGSLGWAGIAFIARTTEFAKLSSLMQIIWQLSVSALVLLLLSLAFGPLIRDFAPVYLTGVAFQIFVMGSAGFLLWFWLLKIYPANGVTSFSFLAPIFGVVFGWLILGEEVGPGLLGALALVCAGLILINRRRRKVA